MVHFALDDSDTEEPEDVRVCKNNVYFYNDITKRTILNLTEELVKLEKELLTMQNDYHLEECPKIFLHINSNGGDAFAGLSAMSMIQNLKVPVVCIADGVVASAATFLLLGATGGRMIRKNSCILIHQIRTEFWGKYAELQDELKNSKNIMKSITKIYQKKSTLPKEKIDNLLKKEIYLTDKRCLRYGLVDSII
jgi:ATP-dependent Clp endopeptidase proteolytic subunit ClpP